MEAYALSIGGICMLLLLVSGTVLSVITIRRMISGQLLLPGWAKIMLSVGMIFMLLTTLISILPVFEVAITNPFVTEDFHVVTPSISETTATP